MDIIVIKTSPIKMPRGAMPPYPLSYATGLLAYN